MIDEWIIWLTSCRIYVEYAYENWFQLFLSHSNAIAQSIYNIACTAVVGVFTCKMRAMWMCCYFCSDMIVAHVYFVALWRSQLPHSRQQRLLRTITQIKDHTLHSSKYAHFPQALCHPNWRILSLQCALMFIAPSSLRACANNFKQHVLPRLANHDNMP